MAVGILIYFVTLVCLDYCQCLSLVHLHKTFIALCISHAVPLLPIFTPVYSSRWILEFLPGPKVNSIEFLLEQCRLNNTVRKTAVLLFFSYRNVTSSVYTTVYESQ